VPVIVVTGKMGQEIACQALAGGALAIVGKPVDLDALMDWSSRPWGRRHARDPPATGNREPWRSTQDL